MTNSQKEAILTTIIDANDAVVNAAAEQKGINYSPTKDELKYLNCVEEAVKNNQYIEALRKRIEVLRKDTVNMKQYDSRDFYLNEDSSSAVNKTLKRILKKKISEQLNVPDYFHLKRELEIATASKNFDAREFISKYTALVMNK